MVCAGRTFLSSALVPNSSLCARHPQDAKIDFMVSSANKCLEGVPGFGYVLARRDVLAQCSGNSRSVSLDLCAQLEGLDKSGQFRYILVSPVRLSLHLHVTLVIHIINPKHVFAKHMLVYSCTDN